MRVAIVHDWLTCYGGAERVLKGLLSIYPNADLFTLIDFLPSSLLGKRAKTTFLQKLPFIQNYYPYTLPLMPYAIEQIDLRGYDLILSSSYAVAKGVITSPDQRHICYCHTPLRALWDMQHAYLGKGEFFKRLLFKKLRSWDLLSSFRVDTFIANSHFVAQRIQKYYRRESQVVYPPVDTSRFPLVSKKEDFYITVSRLVPYKRVDLIVEAFKRMPEKKLMVIGEGPVKLQQTENVILMGHQEEGVVSEMMGKARAFIHAGVEDFGIAPIEAQSCGTPVIAYGKGGLKETISEKTGLFFYEQSPEALMKAIKEFEKREYNPENSRQNAIKFSFERFEQGIKKIIEGEEDESTDFSWRQWDKAVAYVKEPLSETVSQNRKF